MVRPRRNAWNERDEFRGTSSVRLVATLSQAEGTPSEGAETTWGLGTVRLPKRP